MKTKTDEKERSPYFISKGQFKPSKGEIFNDPSLTIQGESYKIKDLVMKGLSNAPTIVRDTFWDLDEQDGQEIDLEKIGHLDFVERAELVNMIGDKIQDLQEKAKKIIETTKTTKEENSIKP